MRLLAAVLVLLSPSTARGIELASEINFGAEFLYASTQIRVGLLDDRIAVASAYDVISNWQAAWHGARVDLAGDITSGLSAGVELGYAPPQAGRDWLSARGHVEVERRFGGASLAADIHALYRRIHAIAAASRIPVDQLRIELGAALTLWERWSLGARGVVSSFRPELGSSALRRADLALTATMGRRAERWALGVRVGRRLIPMLEIEASLLGLAYADGRGHALQPGARVRVGPFHGFAGEAGAEMVLDLPSQRERSHLMGSFALEYSR